MYTSPHYICQHFLTKEVAHKFDRQYLFLKIKVDPRPEFNESKKVAELHTTGPILESPIKG